MPEEGHDVARADDDVEGVSDLVGGEVKLGEVADDPGAVRVVLTGGLDQHGVDVDPDGGVPDGCQSCCNTSRAAARVEDP